MDASIDSIIHSLFFCIFLNPIFLFFLSSFLFSFFPYFLSLGSCSSFTLLIIIFCILILELGPILLFLIIITFKLFHLPYHYHSYFVFFLVIFPFLFFALLFIFCNSRQVVNTDLLLFVCILLFLTPSSIHHFIPCTSQLTFAFSIFISDHEQANKPGTHVV